MNQNPSGVQILKSVPQVLTSDKLCEQGRSACLMLCKQAVSFPNIYLPL